MTEAMILRIKTTIALLLVFHSSLTTLVVQWRQRNLPESAMHFQSFVLLIFSFLLSTLVALQHKKSFDMWRIRLKNRRFDGKRATKSTFAVNHTKAQCWSKSVAYGSRHANGFEVVVSLMQGRHHISSKRQVYVREALKVGEHYNR